MSATASRSKAKSKIKSKTKIKAKSKPAAKAKSRRIASGGAKPERYAGVGDDAVVKATGKSWREWFAILDRARAHEWSHKDIAAHLHEKERAGAWWSQMVTVGYEQARGLRAPNQKANGFAASASKTVAVAASELFDAWATEPARRAWLGPAKLEVRKSTRPKSMRITWSDGSSVQVSFWPKGPSKSQVAIEHEKLASAAEVTRMKTHWRAALARMAARLEE